jgi:hypothetical protein
METYFIINKTVGRSNPVFPQIFLTNPTKVCFSLGGSSCASGESNEDADWREVVRDAIFTQV